MNLYRLTKLYARPFWKRSVRLNRAATLAIFCAAPLSAPCAEISGQVYIVTKAHETVKLALVPVEIYRAEDVRAATKAVDADLKLDRERMATFMSNLRQAQALAKAAHDALWNSADTLPKVNAANRGTNLKLALEGLELSAMARDRVLNGSAQYFERLRRNYRALTSTKTDADGKYAIQVNDAGDLALIASAERQTPIAHELYFWAVPAVARVDLTNDNLTTSNAASLIYARAVDEGADPRITEESLRAELQKIKVEHADILTAIGQALNGQPITGQPLPKIANVTVRARMRTPRGEIIVEPGTRLEIISATGDSLQVRSAFGTATVPISATDVK